MSKRAVSGTSDRFSQLVRIARRKRGQCISVKWCLGCKDWSLPDENGDCTECGRDLSRMDFVDVDVHRER